MVSVLTRNMVWHEFLDVTRLVRYYEELSDRYRRKHRIVRSLLLASAASGIANLLGLLPPSTQDPVQLIANGLVALLVVWDFLADYGKKAEVLQTVSVQCTDLVSQWDQLWSELHDDNAGDSHIRIRNRQLCERLTSITSWPGLVGVPFDKKLNSTCEEDAYRVMIPRYDLSRSPVEGYQGA